MKKVSRKRSKSKSKNGSKSFVIYFMILAMALWNTTAMSFNISGISTAQASEDSNLTQGVVPVFSQWCSALDGIVKAHLGDNPTLTSVPDLNNSGIVDSSDTAVLADLYDAKNDVACYQHFDLRPTAALEFSCENYLDIDWCSGLKQGVTDALGSQIGGARYSAMFDLNDDGYIDASDVSSVAGYLGNNNRAACYTHYNFDLDCNPRVPETPRTPAELVLPEPVSAPWCSSLYGIVESAMGTTPQTPVANLDNLGGVDASDLSIMSEWYAEKSDATCQNQFINSDGVRFNCENYLTIDWCNGLKQGIADSLGSQVGDARYHSFFDINGAGYQGDGFIDASDLSAVAAYMGANDQLSCFNRFAEHYQPFADFQASCQKPIEPVSAPWCSALQGIIEKAMGPEAPGNTVPDIDNNNIVDGSDLSAMTIWKAAGDDISCQTQFDNNGVQFNCENYLTIDWCNGLKQGIADSLGSQVGDARYHSFFDINGAGYQGDGFIDASDLSAVAAYMGANDQLSCFNRFAEHYQPFADFQASCVPTNPPDVPVDYQVGGVDYPSNGPIFLGTPFILGTSPLVLGEKIDEDNNNDQTCGGTKNANWWDMDVADQTSFPDGTLLRGCSPAVYHLVNGQAVHVKTLEELMHNFFGQRIYNVQQWVLDLFL
ncbi:MAG: hypothetical protein C3F02_01160 [Parcubacteria group bacterium]|nr:MAG: hypothetical protein C3F02_01160 [Parcubacteria group bacterium]